MDILIVRHGRAEERSDFALTGKPDSQRPLTHDGIERFQASIPGLKRCVRALHSVATSPWTRARETAEILSAGYGMQPEILKALTPPVDIVQIHHWLQRQSGTCIALVGHEPDLGELVSNFVCGHGESSIPIKKGGACLISFYGTPELGSGELRWLLTPAQLRYMESVR